MAKEASGLTEVLVRRIQTDSGITELRNDARFQLNKRITQAWDMLLKEMEKRRVENGASRNPDS